MVTQSLYWLRQILGRCELVEALLGAMLIRQVVSWLSGPCARYDAKLRAEEDTSGMVRSGGVAWEGQEVAGSAGLRGCEAGLKMTLEEAGQVTSHIGD